MTREEAKTKFKEIMEAEIDRMANHYDVDVVYSNVDKIEELLELNKIVCEAIEKQLPKYPDYEADGYSDGELVYDTWICPNCGMHYEVDYDNYKYCPDCGQALNWEDE